MPLTDDDANYRRVLLVLPSSTQSISFELDFKLKAPSFIHLHTLASGMSRRKQ